VRWWLIGKLPGGRIEQQNSVRPIWHRSVMNQLIQLARTRLQRYLKTVSGIQKQTTRSLIQAGGRLPGCSVVDCQSTIIAYGRLGDEPSNCWYCAECRKISRGILPKAASSPAGAGTLRSPALLYQRDEDDSRPRCLKRRGPLSSNTAGRHNSTCGTPNHNPLPDGTRYLPLGPGSTNLVGLGRPQSERKFELLVMST